MAHDLPVLRELLLIAGASLAIVLLLRRVRVPALVGLIVTGILIGPHSFGLVNDPELVRTLSEIGVVLLLFTVGLEFSVADLRALGVRGLAGGVLQVAITVTAITAVLAGTGLHPARALFFGLLVSLSSTAVVLKLLADRAELSAPHGRAATGVVLVQDLLIVVFVLLVPMLGRWLAGPATVPRAGLNDVLGVLAFLAGVVLAFFAARRAIPWVLGRASRSGSREAFLFGILLVVLGSAALAEWAGVSLAIGAFIAGLMLAESELRPQIAADVLPFRDVLASVFFVAVGMSFEPRAVIESPLLVLAATLGLLAVKIAAAYFALRLLRWPRRIGFAASLVLAQVGEFSFVLAQAGTPYGLFDPATGRVFVAGAVFSLLLSPLLIARASGWALAYELWRGGRDVPAVGGAGGGEHAAAHSELLHDHVVVAGFGLNGRNVTRVLRSTRVNHVVVDLDPDALLRASGDGSRTILGDVTKPFLLGQAGVRRARVLVLALSDPYATRQAVRLARSLSRSVFIIVRTRYLAELDELYALGANQVFPEEFETSIEIFTAVLREFHVPRNVVESQVLLLRQERYSLLRGLKLPRSVVEQLDAILEQGTTDTFLLLQHSPAVDKSLGDLELVDGPGARAVAVVRGGHAETAMDASFRLRVGDTLVLTGTHAEMERAFDRLAPPAPAL